MFGWEQGTTWITTIVAVLTGVGAIYRWGPRPLRWLVRLSLTSWQNQQLIEQNQDLTEQIEAFKRREMLYEGWIAVAEGRVATMESERGSFASSPGLPGSIRPFPPVRQTNGHSQTPTTSRESGDSNPLSRGSTE